MNVGLVHAGLIVAAAASPRQTAASLARPTVEHPTASQDLAVSFLPAEATISLVQTHHDRTAAFCGLVDEYGSAMRRLCGAYARNAMDRDDLFQDIFLAVWRSLPSFRGDATPRTWLYRIAHNTALTWQTRGRRRDRREEPLAPAHAHVASGGTDLRQVALQQAIASLRPLDRMLTLLWLEGLSATEIQEVTGVQAGTVAVRLSRIRQRLTPGKDRS